MFHNDTHSENIRQTKEGEIVLFDWGKGNLSNNSASTSGLYQGMTREDFTNWLDASAQLAKGDYFRDKVTELYGGKKTRRKTRRKPRRKPRRKTNRK
jgi:hypothetical protein